MRTDHNYSLQCAFFKAESTVVTAK